MIKKPTVLVLGAGASDPYGYPTGLKLMEIIIKSLNSELGGELPRYLSRHDIRASVIRKFFIDLSGAKQLSVDAFIEHRDEFQKIGQLSIAYILSKIENEQTFPNRKRGDCWYEYLWNKLCADTPLEDFDKNKLSIITFNYDRSIEQFLIKAMLSLYGEPERCTEKLFKLPIIHVYGSLGPLPWQKPKGKQYGQINLDDPNEMECISNQIKIPFDPLYIPTEFIPAYKVISSAHRIYFLGFGYHDSNLKRLKIKEKKPRNLNPDNMRGSGKGLTSKEKNDIEGKWGLQIDNVYGEVLEFIRNNVTLN